MGDYWEMQEEIDQTTITIEFERSVVKRISIHNRTCFAAIISLFNMNEKGEQLNLRHLEKVRLNQIEKLFTVDVPGDEFPYQFASLEFQSNPQKKQKLSLFYLQLLGRPMLVKTNTTPSQP